MKYQKTFFIIISPLIFIMTSQNVYADSDYYTSDYGGMAYVMIPFGGGETNTSPILGLTASKFKYNQLQTAWVNSASSDMPFIYKRRLLDVMYHWDEQKLLRFNLGGVNALDNADIFNAVGGGGFKTTAALLGVGLAAGIIVITAESSDSDDNNHVCGLEEEHHEEEEEEHHDFSFIDFDTIYSLHPCPEEGEGEAEEEGGHGHE